MPERRDTIRIVARLIMLALLGLCSLPMQLVPAASEALNVENAPTSASVPDDWQDAQVLYASDFESEFEAATPGSWHFIPTTIREEAPELPCAVRHTREGGHVLKAEQHYWLQWPHKVSSGHLRVQFDLYPLPARSGSLCLYLPDLGEPVDFGYPQPIEYGPYLMAEWPEAEITSRNARNQPTALGKLQPNTWQRVTIIVDLDERRFQLFIDGEQRGEDMEFRDYRWFSGTDRLYFYRQYGSSGAGADLLDNVSVHHLPSGSETRIRRPTDLPAPPVIPAHALQSTPKLDGDLSESAWDDAYHTDRFYTLAGEATNEPRMEAWLGYQDDCLYLATRLWPQNMDRVRSSAQRRTQGGWGYIEIFIDPSLNKHEGKYLHLGYDAASNKIQEQGMGQPWDAEWTVATALGKDNWTAEVRIPFAALVAACPPRDTWGINICRGQAIGPDNAALSPTFGNFHVPARFARLTGLSRLITSALRCTLQLPEPLFTGEAQVQATVTGGHTVADKPLELLLIAEGPEGVKSREIVDFTRGDPEGAQMLPVPVGIPKDGPYYFWAQVWLAGEVPDEGTRGGAPLARTVSTFALAVSRGTLLLRTDRNYYTTETTARVRGRLLGQPLPQGSSAVLQIRSPEAQFADQTLLDIHRVVKHVPFMVELPLTDLPLGQMELNVQLLRPDQSKVATARVPLVRRMPQPNEVKIRWDNVLIVDGQPFFPLYIWTKRDLILAHDLGCNAVLMPYAKYLTPERLQLAKELGIRIILRPSHIYRSQEAPGRIEAFRDEAPLLGWFVEDEPHADNKEQATAIEHMVNLLSEMDRYHPTYINIMSNWADAHAYALATDAFGADPYASSGYYRERHVADSTRLLLAATRGQRPIWQTLQVFHPRNDHVHPTPAEFRHSVYSAVVHGATGLGFWGTAVRSGGSDEDIRGLLSDKPLWQEVREVVHTIRELTPVLTSEERVSEGASCQNAHVAIMNKRWQGQHYVWALNMRDAPDTATLSLPVATGELVNLIRPGGSWSFTGGTCKVPLEPLQPLVLRLEEPE